MYVMTIDQVGSRGGEDRVPDLLGELSGIETLAPFERTVGDEVQGVPSDPDAVLRVAALVLRDGGWHCGIGIGAGTLGGGEPPSSRGGHGEAFLRARRAVEASKGEPVSLCVRAADAGRAGDLEALLHLVGILASRRTPSQWAVIDAFEDSGSGAGAAEALGISRQAVSQSLAASAWRAEVATRPLARRLLADLGEES